MKCEICHKAEAATVLRRPAPDGSEMEMFVCKSCAAQVEGLGKTSRTTEAPAQGKSITVSSGEAPEFLENFVKAAMGLMEGIAATEKGKQSCEGCGRTWEQIKSEKRVGCPRCYRTFAELIRNEFLSGAYSRTHVGAMPPKVPLRRDARECLERELKAAVKAQRFEEASKIRRQLDALKGENGEKS